MMSWIGAAMLALLMLGGIAAVNSADAAPLRTTLQTPQASDATDFSARRRTRPYTRYAYRPYVQPYYYDRPDYYLPYPYVLPVPFFLGFGFGPRW